jgi:hypothetical protein
VPAKPATGPAAPSSVLSRSPCSSHTLVITWYAWHGHDQSDIADRRAVEPWYHAEAGPAFEDMLIKLRRTMIAARISGSSAAHPEPTRIRADLAGRRRLTAKHQ